MKTAAILIFLVSYAGIAFGALPRLALDRTGFALLGAIAMVAAGVLPVDVALGAIDTSTILLLYGLMVVSSQFRLGGFYTWTAWRITRHMDKPERFLLLLMAVSAGLSAVLANDIVCLAFTPILAVALLRAGLNPVPFLLGLAISSNIGSAATIIGNPQNMLIGQKLHLDFGLFLLWCLPPALVSLALAYGILLWNYRGGRLRTAQPGTVAAGAGTPAADWPELNRHQTAKGIAVTVCLILLFFTGVPREVTALAAAGFLLCSRQMKSRSLLGLVDWHLITLFCGLFIIICGFNATGVPQQFIDSLAKHGWKLGAPHVLAWVSLGLSNLVSNVPAVMLLVHAMNPQMPVQGYVLALSSTFAGNLILLGSIANLIVVEQARAFGITISFKEHAKTGVMVTLASMAVLLLWLRFAPY